MDTSVFTGSGAPADEELKKALGRSYNLWNQLKEYVFAQQPDAAEEWNLSKFGWNYRIKDKKRAIIYLMPCSKYFKASFVLGAKATEMALGSNISEGVKDTIRTAKVYAEGRGIRMDVGDKQAAGDAQKLVDIKLSA